MRHVLGQSRAIEALLAPLASGRVHHAFIFSGPVGVGKFTTAVAFAKLLLCQDRQTTLAGEIEACGSCASCRLVPDDAGPPVGDDEPEDADAAEHAAIASAHPDLHVVTKELAKFSDDRATRDRKLTQIPVEVLRTALIEPVYRAAQLPGAGERSIASKVFILDEAELLNPTGQNLLLKTLEEPPAGTVVILVTSSEDRLLPTIRSRCQRVTFVPLGDEVVRKWVERQAAQDTAAAKLAPTEREWVVSFASGSLGRAKLALDYGLAEWARRVLPVVDGVAAGRPAGLADLGATLASLIDGFAAEWVDRHDNASKEAANKLAAGLMWSALANHARRKLADVAEKLTPGDADAAEAATEPWLALIHALDDAERYLATNVNLSLVCDHLAARLARALDPAAVLPRA